MKLIASIVIALPARHEERNHDRRLPGANGATGRLLTRQALAPGHQVAAVTRKAGFPVTHARLSVVEADVHDAPDVGRAVEGADVVLSALGVPYTRKPVNVYSDGIRNIAAAMSRHQVKRLAVVSSAPPSRTITPTAVS